MMPAATLVALLLAILHSIFAASSAKFTDVHGFQDSTTTRRSFTTQDFKGEYSRFLELSNVDHMCPLKIHISSNGQQRPENSVLLPHSAFRFDQATCTDGGSLLFHHANQLTPDQISNHFRLTGTEADFFQRGLHKFLTEIRSFYLAVESIPITCGNNSLQAGGAVLFSSDSAVFGGELHLPYNGFPKIVYIRDSTKTCAYFGPWMTPAENPTDATAGNSDSSSTSADSVGPTRTPVPSPKGTITPRPTVSVSSMDESASGAEGTSDNNGDGMMGSNSANSGSMGVTDGTGPPTTATGTLSSSSSSPTSGTSETTTSPSTSSSEGATGSQMVSATTPSTTGTGQVGSTGNPSTGANGGMPDATTDATTAPPGTTTGATADSSSTLSVGTTDGGSTSPSSTVPTSSTVGNAGATSLAASETQNMGADGTGIVAPTTTTLAPSTSSPTTTGADRGFDAGSAGGSSTSTTTVATAIPESGTGGTESSGGTSSPGASSESSSGPSTARPTTTNLDQTPESSAESSTLHASGNSSTGMEVSLGPQPAATGSVQIEGSDMPQPENTLTFNVAESPFVFPMPSFEDPLVLVPSPIDQGVGTITPSVSVTAIANSVLPSPSKIQVNLGHGPLLTPDGIDFVSPEPSAVEISESLMPNPGMNITESDLDTVPSSVQKSASPSPSRSAGSVDESTCFPAHAIALLQSGRRVRMSSLSVGDIVHVGQGVFSPIIGFTHSNPWKVSPFVKMTTQSGYSALATPTHYMHSSRGLLPAGLLSTDDSLFLSDGSLSRITALVVTPSLGLYNPQTAQGNIDVDGILASTYTTAIQPATAHSLLAPVRMMQSLNVGTGFVSILSEAVWIARAAKELLAAT